MLRYFYAAVTFYLVAFYSFWLKPWSHWRAFCAKDELLAVCGREWLGSLSGWFGGAAAFLAITYVIRQINEQKRQTDFLIGDAEPTLDVTPDLSRPREIVVRVVNWNRRGIILRDMRISNVNEIAITEATINGENRRNTSLPMSLHGWEDRSAGPHVLQLKVIAMADGELVLEWPNQAMVEIQLHVLGDKHEIRRLAAAVHP